MPTWFSSNRARLLDALWLLALALYIAAGVPLVSFHGDEAMQVYMSDDYAVAFFDRDLPRLTAGPPYNIDAEAQLRILNGSVNRYSIGLAWHLAGYSRADLPPAPGWDWGLDYDTNVASGHRPPDALLWLARLPSALLLAVSAAAMFGLGWQMGGRPLAYAASALYTLNPVILLNGRRAMMEGSLLAFGLLAVLLAAVISRKRAQGAAPGPLWWLALAAAAALTLASKHSGAVFVAAAFGWVALAELLRRRPRELAGAGLRLAASGALALALFVALSPALWGDPPARLLDLAAVRAELLSIQVQADPAAPMPLAQRAEFALTQPFIAPAMHFEAGGWTSFAPISGEIARYMQSPLSGWQFGPLAGAALTLLAAFGAAALAVPRLRGGTPPGHAAGLLLWLALVLAVMFANPLPWQRYYLPLIPPVTLLAVVGLAALLRWRRRG